MEGNAITFSFLLSFVLQTAFAQTSSVAEGNKLIIISFDGFRWNYLQRTDTPNFDKFLQNGVHARHGIKDAFVTKTFPNHFTLVTGMWEESHGIVNNEMYDPELDAYFSPSDVKANADPAWYSVGAEPIWVTNQLQKVNGRSGNIMWVGGSAPIKWVRPSRYLPFNDSVGDYAKVDTLIEWFTDEYPINLGLMYFTQPDADGHTYGPESDEVTKRIAHLDKVVGYLLEKLENNTLMQDLNIIITSDHGFSSTPKDKVINLDDYIDPNSFVMTGMTPIANIWPNDGKYDEILQNLTKGASENSNFTVLTRETVPEFFHYSHNQRIAPILVVAQDHFSFIYAKNTYTQLGNHGYDNRQQNMHPFFIAMGPDFKKGYAVDTFNSVDVYPLMCNLLQLTPGPNNGSMDIVQELLVSDKEEETTMVTFITYIIGGVLVASVASIFAIGACRYHRYMKSLQRYHYSTLEVHRNQSTSVADRLDAVEGGIPETTLPLLSASDTRN